MKIFTSLFFCLFLFFNNLSAQTGTAKSAPIKIKLSDLKNTDSTKRADNKIDRNVELKNTRPVIVVIEPVMERGKKLSVSSQDITVSAKVTDTNGITEVLINGIKAKESKNQIYKANIKLYEEINIITVIAKNRLANSSEETLVIVRKKEEIANLPFERKAKDYALFFATDKYDFWYSLVNPINDSKTIAEELKKNYNFEVDLIENPNQDYILSKLRQFAKNAFDDNDQLFIFFAGHGQYDEVFQEGFIVAKDSKQNDEGRISYISQNRLRGLIDNIPCKHIFLVMDVCFGGTFDPVIAKNERGQDEYTDIAKTEFIQRKLKYKTRRYLTSGGKEYVSDGKPGQNSPFARKFLEALRSYGGKDGILTINEIISYIEKVKPEPRFGEFGSNEPGSDFIFIAK